MHSHYIWIVNETDSEEKIMRLYIIRHGETDWNKEKKIQGHTDIPLNEYGRHLAEETAEGMKDILIDLCFTSPLLRAKETAQIVLGDREIPVIEEPRIMEIGFGSFEGKGSSTEAFRKFFSDTADYVAPEDGETVLQLYERTGAFLKELCGREDLKDKKILVSTHGAAMTALLNRIRGNVSVEEFWKEEVPPNCAVTTVDVEGKNLKIVKENQVFYKEEVRHWKAV